MGRGDGGEECQETNFTGMKEHMPPFTAHLAVGIVRYILRNQQRISHREVPCYRWDKGESHTSLLENPEESGGKVINI